MEGKDSEQTIDEAQGERQQQQDEQQQQQPQRRERDAAAGERLRYIQQQQQQQAYYYSQHLSQAAYHAYGYQYMDLQQQQNQWAAMVHHHHHGYHYPLQQQMEGVPLPPGIPGLGGSTDPLEAVLGPFPCARLRNLPYDVSLEDILGLFQGLVVIDVVIIGGGEAFVIFANPMDFQMGLQRNRQTIGRRFIEIAAATRADYYEAVAAVHEQERGPKLGSGLRGEHNEGLRRGGSNEDQPSGDTASTVAALWGGQSPPGTGVHSSLQAHAGGFGVDHGLGLHGTSFGSARSTSGGRDNRGGLHAPPAKRTGGGIQIGEHTGFLRMRGLPFSAMKEDIFKFFVGYNPILDSIVLTYRNDGRATGEAYVGFASPEDAERAMALHRRSMGSRYIELFISNKDEQGRALARFGSR